VGRSAVSVQPWCCLGDEMKRRTHDAPPCAQRASARRSNFRRCLLARRACGDGFDAMTFCSGAYERGDDVARTWKWIALHVLRRACWLSQLARRRAASLRVLDGVGGCGPQADAKTPIVTNAAPSNMGRCCHDGLQLRERAVHGHGRSSRTAVPVVGHPCPRIHDRARIRTDRFSE